MADMFTHEARLFKFQILTEVAQNVFHADLDEDKVQKNVRNLVSLGGERFRCCVYKEREVLIDRYIIGKTQNEIAKLLNISQAQVSRIEKSAIKQMRNNII